MHARTLLAALAVALLALVGLSIPASADLYPPAGVRVVAGTVSDAAVTDGGQVTFSGGGFAPGALLRVSVDGAPASTVTADGAGAFSLSLTLRGVGVHVLAASGLETGGRVRVVSATVTVTATAAAGGGLPFTGSDILFALLAGLGLVALGTASVVVSRMRRRMPVPLP